MRHVGDLRIAHALVVATIPASAVVLLWGAAEPVMLPRWWMVIVGAVIGGAVLVIGACQQRRVVLPPVWFLGVVCLLVVGLVVSVLTADEQMRAAMGTYSRWTGASGYLAYAVLGLIASVTADDTKHRGRLGSVILGTAAFVAGYALLQRAGLDPLPWDNVYAPSSPSILGNPNFASAFIGIPVPLIVARVLVARSRGTRVAYALLVVLLVAGLVATGSWLGSLAMAVGLFSMTALVMLTSGRTAYWRTGIAMGLGLPAAGIGIVWALWTRAVTAGGTIEIRLYYWRAALGMFTDHPFLGVGLGRFEDFFRRYRPISDYPQLAESAFTDNPHSVPLTLASEGGLVVLVPWLLFVVVVAALAKKWAGRTRRDPILRSERLMTAAWFGAFTGYVAQALASFDVPPIAVLGFVLAGSVAAMTGGTVHRSLGVSRAVRRGLTWAAAVGAVAMIVAAGVPMAADITAGEALDRDRSGDLVQAVQLFDQAAARAWWEPRYRFAAAQVAYSMGDFDLAQRRFEATAQTFPQLFQPALRSARIAAELGEPDRAVEWYRRALVLEPNDQELAVEARAIIDSESSTP